MGAPGGKRRLVLYPRLQPRRKDLILSSWEMGSHFYKHHSLLWMYRFPKDYRRGKNVYLLHPNLVPAPVILRMPWDAGQPTFVNLGKVSPLTGADSRIQRTEHRPDSNPFLQSAS